MRIVFMGTPQFSVPILRALDAAYNVVGVVTRPDAVRGRGHRPVPSPVKAEALARGLRVIEARRMTPQIIDELCALKPDVTCVAAFGCILDAAVLKLGAYGCVNVHASLLPRWRGAAPVQRAILAGDARVGVSIMRVVHELDAGAYCTQVATEVADKSCEQLLGELSCLGAKTLVSALHKIESGTAVWTQQDEARVTYAHKVEKAEMCLNPTDAVCTNARRVQASTDAAPARCDVAGRAIRVTRARLAEGAELAAARGELVVVHGRVALGCADGALEVLRVKPDGKREMETAAWAAGLRASALPWRCVG